jgi:hypothetical protein
MPAQPSSGNTTPGSAQRRKTPAILLIFALIVLPAAWLAGGEPLHGPRIVQALAPESGPIRVTKSADPTEVIAPGGAVQFTARIDNTSSSASFTIDTLVPAAPGPWRLTSSSPPGWTAARRS